MSPRDPAGRPAPGPAARTTVVIATRDRCGELLRTLDELARLRPRAPVVVVDNGSTDGTPERLARERPEVTAVRAGRNLGAAGRNLGVLAARTPYVAFSDDDSWWSPDALRTAEHALDRHPRVGLVAARTLVEPRHVPDPVTDLLAGSPLGRDGDLPGPSVLGFLACSAIVRREAFQAVGGFSALLFFGGEETLLAWDLAAAGWELCYLADVVAHHQPSTRRGDGAGRQWLERRNALLMAWMRRSPSVGMAATRKLAGEALHDAAARRTLAAAVRRLPRSLAARDRLPHAVEDRVRLLEREHA